MADKNPFDVELPKKSSNPFDVDIAIEKKNLVGNDLPTGTQTSKRGFEPFLPQEDTKYAIQESVEKFRGGADGYSLDDIKGGNSVWAGIFDTPSVLLSDEQKQQAEKNRIGKRFETTLLNVPTEFGKVGQFMRSAKKVKDTLPQTPTLKPDTGGMVVIPDGSKIGDSLRKGDTLQDELTDKLTGKKTALQKQIENAENAFRAYQGDEIANQAQGYVPPEETLKIKQELGFGEKMSNAGSNFVNKLERFVPNTALALGQTLTTLLGEDYGSDAYRMITASGNADIHRMEAFDKLAKLDAEYKYSKGLIQSVQDLDLGGVAAAVTDAVGSLISTVVTSAPTAGLGLYADMVGSGLYDYNSTKANRLGITVEQLYDSGQNDFFVPAILGGVGAQLEKIGLKGIKQGILSNIKSKAGQKAGLIFHNSNKEGFTEWTQSGLEAYSNSLAQGKNAIQAGEEAVKEMFSKKGAESYLMGTVAAGAAIGGGRILRGIVSSREKKKAADALQKIEQQQQELSNPDISEESRVFIFDNIKNNVKEVVDAVYADVDESDNLSENQKKEVFELNKTIQALEIVANDPAVSEETKASAQTRIDELKSKVDGIIATPEIKLAKPTFDTEEQLVEEIRAAEKEFNETGDAAEYQLKINDLNTRLDNLVPAPEGAEIGEPSQDQKLKDIQEGNTVTFTYANESEVPDVLKDKISSVSETNGVKQIRVTLSKSEADYLLKPKEDAVSQSISSKIPVLTEAATGKEVEQGKPQPKAEVVTEEGGKAEEVGGDVGDAESVIRKVYDSQKDKINKGEYNIFSKLTSKDYWERTKAGELAIKKFNELGESLKERYGYDVLSNVSPLDIIQNRKNKIIFNNKGNPIAIVKLVSESSDTFYDYDKYTKELKERYGSYVILDNIYSLENGGGKEAINQIKDIADKNGVSIILKASGIENPQTDKLMTPVKKLKNIYTSLGFEKVEFKDRRDTDVFIYKPKEQTPAQQVEQLRAEEQAELKAAIPNADQYLTDGKVDRAKITDAKDLEAFDEIYDKYDKLITPLLPKKEAPAKAEPKLKSKVATRLLFKKAVDLFYDISGTEGSAKKRTISAKRRTFMEQNPSIKYIDDNWDSISKQLEAKGLLTKSKGCP